MPSCPACGKERPGEFPFCPFCGAPLAETAPSPALEERKVVSVLFCDLVGFTAASEQQDPEDVRARIRPYHARLRSVIEAHGGTVEKFVGDAVMAVFGAPVAHEDDAERAVRAGLAVLEAIAELNEADPDLELQVRVGINTGEAVVALAARPEEGEGIVTGDVVNTAARIESAGPAGAVAVGEQTHRATERVFEYEPLEPVSVKGKSEPLPLWRARAARSRFGTDITRRYTTPLVGRELEKPLLIGTFERAAQQRSVQLATIVGEPGVGKSRLCAELFGYIESRPGLVRWRQGRCLPYGEDIAFWALGEIVKAECGILESDSPAEAEAKLERALDEDDPDRVWLRARLSPLVGLPGEPVAQEESFAAWRRFLEALAAERETVLVFEDLHWADPALLAFIQHLADWAQGVPLVLLCTARPELYEEHSAWAAGLRNATTINLAPLTDEETAGLIGSLLERAVLPAATQKALLERAGGNPLYAEEFVRLLADRGELAEVVVPDSVHALIAARLDTLSPERKSLLQDAAVLGKIFWAGALAAMAGCEQREVELALHELSRKELVRPVRSSTIEGEAEYGFWHLLVRDVCYSQIPRAGRVVRHREAAGWLERQAGERAEDLADVLAHHYVTALELAHATGQEAESEHLEASAIRYLALAGERALALDVERAEQSFARALALSPVGHPERARLLERWAQAGEERNRLPEVREALDEALAIHRERGDSLAAGRVLTVLSNVLQRLGDPRQEAALAEALDLLEAQLPGQELVDAHVELAGRRATHAAYPESIVAAERALALAAELRLPEPVRALGLRGTARCYLGERQGLEDMRQALQLAVAQGLSRSAAGIHNNLALGTWQHEGPQAAFTACREGIDFCERRGIETYALEIGGMSMTFAAACGRAEQVVSEAAPLAERLEEASTIISTEPRAAQLRVLAERGAHTQAQAPDKLVAAARETGEPQLCAIAFGGASRLLVAQGDLRGAEALLVELEQVEGIRADPYYGSLLPEFVRTACALENPDLAVRLVEGVEPRTPLVEHALMSCRAEHAEAAREHADGAALYARAADHWREFGDVPELAYALLGEGRCLLAVGDPVAQQPLRQAAELFRSMGYRPILADTEALIAQTTALAS